MSDDFKPGELLTWENRANPDSQLVRRPVTFHGWKNNQAIVSFGLKFDGTGEPEKLMVPKSEVFRPVPEHAVKPPPPPLEPPPPVPLDVRREELRQCYQSFDEAQELVVEAEELVRRGQERVDQSQRVLRQYRDLESHHADAIVHSLKHLNGGLTSHSVVDDDEEWQARDRATRDAIASETALQRLTSDLVHARDVAHERELMLERQASLVVGTIIERETVKLHQLEQELVEVRAVLRAASMLWVGGAAVPVSPHASTILTTWPYDLQEPIGQRVQLIETRQRPFADLLTRLISGEIDADFSWYMSDEPPPVLN